MSDGVKRKKLYSPYSHLSEHNLLNSINYTKHLDIYLPLYRGIWCVKLIFPQVNTVITTKLQSSLYNEVVYAPRVVSFRNLRVKVEIKIHIDIFIEWCPSIFLLQFN
jgi:hypothetical protein